LTDIIYMNSSDSNTKIKAPIAMPVGDDGIPIAIPLGDDDLIMNECLFYKGTLMSDDVHASERYPDLSQRERFQMIIGLGEAMRTFMKTANTKAEDSRAFVACYKDLCRELHYLSN
jgi:hypothetical protein